MASMKNTPYRGESSLSAEKEVAGIELERAEKADKYFVRLAKIMIVLGSFATAASLVSAVIELRWPHVATWVALGIFYGLWCRRSTVQLMEARVRAREVGVLEGERRGDVEHR